MGIDADFDDFYTKCLMELKARDNWTEAFIPLLDRYVTLTIKLAKLNSEIVDKEVIQDHTNKAKEKNEVSSAEWRMYLALNSEANKLAKQLKLCPETAPKSIVEKPKGTARFMKTA
jgi:hypothetical protein